MCLRQQPYLDDGAHTDDVLEGKGVGLVQLVGTAEHPHAQALAHPPQQRDFVGTATVTLLVEHKQHKNKKEKKRNTQKHRKKKT